MEQLIVYAILVLAAITLVTAMLGIASWAAMHYGGPEKNQYNSKIFAGIAYFTLGLNGLLCSYFVTENHALTYILSWLFGIMGVFILRSGLRLRKKMKGR